jgi:hypothetical protein
MKPLVQIPYVALDGETPFALLARFRAEALALMKAARGTFGPASYLASAALLPVLDALSWRWLEASFNPYREEIYAIAREVGVPGAIALNVCFEWGCTGGVWGVGETVLLRRVLDWPFPRLGEMTVVARQTGPAGAFHNVTWPGFAGVLQASAPGRFAAAINQAPMKKRGLGFVGDWALNRLAVPRALPPAHLLRRAFETAPDYAAAKAMLCQEPLAVPAIFILSGTRRGEGCVIERSERTFSLREIADGRVCAANHFVKPPEGRAHAWRARPIDSKGRYALARTLAGTEDFSWFLPPIANVNSRLALIADAANGMLAVMGTMGARPSTEIFRLPINA